MANQEKLFSSLQACLHSSKDDSSVIDHAAKRRRKNLSLENQTVNGDNADNYRNYFIP